MNHVSVRRRSLALAVLTAASVLTACEDKRVKQLSTGITRDSALTVIAQDMKPSAGPDSFPNVYTRSRYLINGKNYEVLFFVSDNEKQGKDSVRTKNLTPIVFRDNLLIGRGWDFWDSVSKANNIPLQKR